MSEYGEPEVSDVLIAWQQGDPQALRRLMPIVYSELRQMARAHLAHERPGHTLQPTALVNEVYLRLADTSDPVWQNRRHFMASAGTMMRWILVDYARQKRAAKRGGGQVAVEIRDDLAEDPNAATALDIIAFDQALSRLEELSPRQARVIELRFFAGLPVDETAAVLGISTGLVWQEQRVAKSWLFRELSRKR